MHTEKQRIFNEYAKIKEYENWKDLDDMNTNFDEFMLHVFEACDLVQQKTLQKASQSLCEIFIDDEGITVRDSNKYCNSILNPENLIK